MSYNGWSNYETWNVHLWLSNDEASYHEARRIVERAWDVDRDWEAADALKAWVTDCDNGIVPDLGGTMAGDLLGAALSEVDWLEVAKAFAPEPDESEDEDETAEVESGA